MISDLDPDEEFLLFDKKNNWGEIYSVSFMPCVLVRAHSYRFTRLCYDLIDTISMLGSKS